MIEKVKLSNGDEVWLSGRGREWRVIYPIKNEDGSWNRKNLLLGGSWRRFLMGWFVVLLILVSVFAYKHDVGACLEILKDPQSICNYRYYGSNLTLNESLVLNIGNSSLGLENLQFGGVSDNLSVPSEEDGYGVRK